MAVLTKSRVAALSVASNTSLVIFKVIVGLSIGSISVISEAIHSGVDLLAAIIALYAVTHSDRPADKRHPFGHGKIENISGVVEALLIFLAAGWIIFEAIKKLMHPEPMDTATWGIVVMGVSCVVNVVVSKMLFKVGKATDSIALQADAWHLRTDVWTSFGVMSGLSIILVGKLISPSTHLDWVDPAAAMAVALLIVKAAWHLTEQSFHDLMDVSLPENEVEKVRRILDNARPRIDGYHALRTRKAGAARFVEVHMIVDPRMTVDESHALTDRIADSVNEQIGKTRVTVHIEPNDGSHPVADEEDERD